MLSTVERAFQVLHLFTPLEPVWGATAVAGRLQVPKSCAHELLQTLVHLGVLDRLPRGQFRLGALNLLGALNAGHPWLPAARWAMHELARLSGEAAHLSVVQGGTLLHLEGVQAAGEPWPASRPARVPPQCSAMGKVLLCAWPWPDVERLIERQGLAGLTVNSIVTPDELQTELQRIRERGYAYDMEEAFPGVCCIAAPLRGPAGEVLAAISVSAPTDHFYQHKSRWRALLLEVCDHASRTLATPALAGA
ncbi:IclR family transcriptional regulator [Deinococcus sonorensis]|uniref:IclR family transcriptional regulator n=2 Tax=Deinococcus sonorensis TaxID=309891 RepID=A0AAU7UCQ7_9DEIO